MEIPSQSPLEAARQKAHAKNVLVSRFIRATGCDPAEWENGGYSTTFERLWSTAGRNLKNDLDALYTLVLADPAKRKTANIIAVDNLQQMIDEKYGTPWNDR